MIHTKHSHPFFARMAVTALLGTLLTAAPTAAANQAHLEDGDIPTRIVIPTDPERYPDPICLGCKIVAEKPSEADDASGSLRVTYDEAPTFTGHIVVTVVLLDGRDRRTVVLEEVVLTGSQTAKLLIPPGVDWSWDDVESVWIELVPAS